MQAILEQTLCQLKAQIDAAKSNAKEMDDRLMHATRGLSALQNLEYVLNLALGDYTKAAEVARNQVRILEQSFAALENAKLIDP